MSERRVEDCPIKFGPLWLRNFSREGSAGGSGGAGGSSGATPAAPPPATSSRPQLQPTKYKLAQYRYGREEMLALYENDLDPPAGLQSFEPLYVPNHQRPLALTTDALDEEPREHARNVGLNRNAGAAGVAGGTSMERFGRGLSDLSRGRGRPHQPYSLTTSERPGSYREDNPYGEPPAPGLTRSWSSGPNAPLGRSTSDNPDWNQNRPYKSRWPEPNWRSQSGRTYGEESEPARRVLVPLGRPRQPLDKRDKEKVDRPTSWTASRRNWSGEQQFSEDNLPEWATEGDTEASGGTFDSSGAFHDVDAPARRPTGDSFYGLARSHTQGTIGVRSRSHDEESPVAGDAPPSWWNTDKGPDTATKKFDATNIKFKKPPPTNEETRAPVKNETSFETSDDQFERAVAKVKNLKVDDTSMTESKKKMVSFSEEKFGPPMTFDALMKMNQADEGIDERGGFTSALITQNNSLRKQHQNIVGQPQPVPVKPELPQLERQVLPENSTPGLPKPEDIGMSQQGGPRSRGLDAFTAFGLPSKPVEVPSTQSAFQQFIEPSPHKLNDGTPYQPGVDTQDMLKNAALQMVNDSNTWYYEDPQKNVQGPFTPSEMRQWYRAGFFSPDLMIRRASDKQMRSLGSFGDVPPFAENVSELLAFLTRKIMLTENDGQEKTDVQTADQLQQQKTQLQHSQLPQPQSHQSQLQQTQLQQLLLSQQQSQMPQSQMLQSLLQESHRQQLQLQQSQLLQLQLQQSQMQQSQLEPTAIQSSYLQQSQLPQSQIHQAHLQQSHLHPSQLQQSQLQSSLLSQAPLHQTPLQQSLLQQPQLPPTPMHQSQLPQSKHNQIPLPQTSLQDILLNKTQLQQQPAQWNTPHPFATPQAMLATSVAAPPNPVISFGSRTHSTFLEQIIQPQRMAPETVPEVKSKPEAIVQDTQPSSNMNFSFLSRPPPPITTRVQTDISDSLRARTPTTSDDCAPQFLDSPTLYQMPEKPFEAPQVSPPLPEEQKESVIKKVDSTPEKERESNNITPSSQAAVELKQAKPSMESKEKASKSKEAKAKTKSSKTKERPDGSSDRKTEWPEPGKNDAKVEDIMPGFTKVVNKKEEKQSKKEKKESIQEIPAATKASQRKNPDKKKSEEVKAAEEAERRRKEERSRIVEDLKEEAFFINNLEKKYKQMEAQLDKARQPPPAPAVAAPAGSKKAPWSAPSLAAPAASTDDGLTLAEIQKLEREKKFESIKEQQQMMQLIAQQQQAALAREQEIQQTTGYNWAKYKPNKNNDSESVQSLAEIQEETRRRQVLEIARQEPAAPPPAAAAPTQAPWTNGGSSYMGGFWESSPGAAGLDEKVSPRRGQPEPQPTRPSKKAAKAAASPTKEPREAKKTSPTVEFDTWCLKVLTAWSSKIDVPIFVGFLKDIESAYEVKDYVKSYLGETKESTDFARNFLEKRSKLMRGTHAECVDDLSAPAAAKNPASGAAVDFQEVKGKGKKVKKNKMLKVDTRILGFSVTAAENRINVGDIESL